MSERESNNKQKYPTRQSGNPYIASFYLVALSAVVRHHTLRDHGDVLVAGVRVCLVPEAVVHLGLGLHRPKHTISGECINGMHADTENM